MSNHTPDKRPVARHAYLACREKKVKCDGEIVPATGGKDAGKEIRHQQCTNCRTAGIECVFVKSQRGGRRKKDPQGSDMRFSISSTGSNITSTDNVSLGNRSASPPRFDSFRNNNNDFLATARSHFYNTNRYGDRSPSISESPSLSTTPSSSHFPAFGTDHSLQEKIQQLQKETANIKTQLRGREGSETSAFSDHYFPMGPPPGPPPPGPPPFHPFRGHHHPHHPHSFGKHHDWSFPPPPPPPPHHHPHHPFGPGGIKPLHPFDHPFFGSHHPPGPPPHLRDDFGDKDDMSKRPFDDDGSRSESSGSFQKGFGFTLPKVSKLSKYIQISDEELDAFDLPPWHMTTVLIDLYYRYIHPSRPFLPPKHRLIFQLQVRQHASLLHAMFSCSCRFASSTVISSQNLKDPQHWYFLAEKYWDYMDLETSLQALVLLMGDLVPSGHIQQSLEGFEKISDILDINNVMNTQIIRDWSQFAATSTKKHALRHEDMLRTIWCAWKFNAFLRLNRGAPYTKISSKLLEFPMDLPLPQSDALFNLNLHLFDNDNAININRNSNKQIQSLQYKTWDDVKRILVSCTTNPMESRNLTDSDLIIIAINHLEEIMDTISTGNLSSIAINNYNSTIKLLEDITNMELYEISRMKKKTAILNISRLFSCFVLTTLKLNINVTQCSNMLLIKPREQSISSNSNEFFNALYGSKLEDVASACLSLSPEQLLHYLEAFLSALDAVRLLEIGLGKIVENDDSNTPITVVGGPLNFTPASEISSLKSNENWWIDSFSQPGTTISARAEMYSEYPDVWLQYPILSIGVVANALTVLISSIVLTKLISIREAIDGNMGVEHGFVKIEARVNGVKTQQMNGDRSIPIVIHEEKYKQIKENFNPMNLNDKIRLCSKFIQVHGRFWPHVESIAVQVEAMINYVDDVTSRL